MQYSLHCSQVVITEDEDGNLLEDPLLVAEAVTNDEGSTGAIAARSGCLLQARLIKLPEQYLDMQYMDRVVEQQSTVRLTDEHTMRWEVPRKPQLAIRVHDAASGERVHGVQYRLMVRHHAPSKPQARVSFGGGITLPRSRQHLQPFMRHPQCNSNNGMPYQVRAHFSSL